MRNNDKVFGLVSLRYDGNGVPNGPKYIVGRPLSCDHTSVSETSADDDANGSKPSLTKLAKMLASGQVSLH